MTPGWSWKQWASLLVMLLGILGVIVILIVSDVEDGKSKAAIVGALVATMLGVLGMKASSGSGSPKPFDPARVLAPALIPLLLFGSVGCAALAPVRAVQDFEVGAWAKYVGNVGKINRLRDELYAAEREFALEAATERSLALIAAQDQITGTDAAAAAKLIVERREKIQAKTGEILAALRALDVQNNREAEIALRANALLREYMNAGVDEAEVRPYIDAAVAAIRARLAKENISVPPIPD